MSGAKTVGAKGSAREPVGAAEDSALRHGLTLGEWLNQAVLAHEEASSAADRDALTAPGPELTIPAAGDDWALNGGAETQRMVEALKRLSERLESTERRHALVTTGLDRSVLGLAARVEDAEAGVRKNAVTVTGAVEALRRTGDEISQRVAHAEAIAREAATEVLATIDEFTTVQSSIDGRFTSVEENARRSAEEIAANALSEARANQLELQRRVDGAEAASRAAAEQAVAEIRTAQNALAQRMAEAEADAKAAALDAVRVLRDEQQGLAERVGAAEAGGQAAAQETMRELQATQASMHARLQEIEAEARRATAEVLQEVRRAHEELEERIVAAGTDSSTAIAVVDIESAQRTLAERLIAIEAIARDSAARAAAEVAEGQRGIELRLEQIEAATREAAANLRMGAAAAINQVRASQLDLEKRVKLVEAGATFGAAGDGDVARQLHQQIEERLERIERDPGRGQDRAALHMLDAKITGLAAAVRDSREKTAQEIETLHKRNAGSDEFTTRIETLEQSVEGAIARLAERLASAEATANEAIRALEHAPGAQTETDAFRSMVEERLDGMATSMTEIRTEFATRIATAEIAGSGDTSELDAALADVNRRVAAAERRQAHTIEAISIEIRRMSENIDKRLRSLETRNDDSAAVAVREEVERLSLSLDERLCEIDQRELATADRVGAELGRLAERFDDRFDGVERRSAEAIEHVGEQVARMAERFTHRQESMARELTERIVESEERQSSRLTDAISNLNARMVEAEELSGSSISPVQKAMSSLAERLQAVEDSVPGVKRASYEERGKPEVAVVYALSAKPSVDVEFDTPVTAANEADNRSGELQLSQSQSIVDDGFINHDGFIDDDAGETGPEFGALEEPASTFDSYDDTAVDMAAFEETLTEIPASESGASAIEALTADDVALPWEHEETIVEEPAIEDLFEAPGEQPEAAALEKPQKPENYMAAARRAAQAAQTTGKRARSSPPAKAADGLRGPNRVIIWGAAGAIAVALAGGAYVWTKRNGEQHVDTRPAPDPKPDSPVAPPPLDPAAAGQDAQPADITGANDANDVGVASTSIADAAAKAKADAQARNAPKTHADRISTGFPVEAPHASVQTPQTRQIAATATTGPIAISLDQAALRGDAVAQYELGLQRLSGGQTPEGVSLLRRAANQGLAMAQYRLAKLFERGEGVPVDLAQARQWTERAAAAGNRKAMHDLGVFYARGEGAPLDEASAFRWFRQAAELGVADSQFNLGVLYQQGRGTTASASEALYWFSIAARAGDNDARARMATLESQIAPEQIAQVRVRVGEFRARPASARANGEFGQRVWTSDSASTSQPRRS